MNMTPDGGGGSTSSGGPNEQKLFMAAFGASTSQIDSAGNLVRTAAANLEIVTNQLNKLVPQIREAWPSADGDIAARSTRDLHTTLTAKTHQLTGTYAALADAHAAVTSAQDYWSSQQPAPTPPTQPTAPTTSNGDVPDGAALKEQSQYREDKSSFDGQASAREAAMQKQYEKYQQDLGLASDEMARVNSIKIWNVEDGGSFGDGSGGSGGPVYGGGAGGPVYGGGAGGPVYGGGAGGPVYGGGAGGPVYGGGAGGPVYGGGAVHGGAGGPVYGGGAVHGGAGGPVYGGAGGPVHGGAGGPVHGGAGGPVYGGGSSGPVSSGADPTGPVFGGSSGPVTAAGPSGPVYGGSSGPVSSGPGMSVGLPLVGPPSVGSGPSVDGLVTGAPCS